MQKRGNAQGATVDEHIQEKSGTPGSKWTTMWWGVESVKLLLQTLQPNVPTMALDINHKNFMILGYILRQALL